MLLFSLCYIDSLGFLITHCPFFFIFIFLVGTEQFVQASLPFKRLMEPLACKSVDFVSNWRNFVGI